MELKYFKDEEFRKAQPSCSLSDMDEEFMTKLDLAREIAGCPFIINSAFRSRAYELSKGRSGSSVHIQGRAVDLRCLTNDIRYRIIDALLIVGFRRIGIGSNFIHVDSGYSDSPSPLMWLY